MARTFKDFVDDYESFQRIISEYNTAFQFGLGHMASAEEKERRRLLLKLDVIDTYDKHEREKLRKSVTEDLAKLKKSMDTVSEAESRISERRYRRFRDDSASQINPYMDQEGLVHSFEDIDRQTSEAVRNIKKITDSRIPAPAAAVWSVFDKDFRMETYGNILKGRHRLEAMVEAAQRDVKAGSENRKQELDRATSGKVAELQAEKEESDAQGAARKNAYLNQLKNLLLDGMERMFKPGTAYGSAYSSITKYIGAYLGKDASGLSAEDEFLIGIASQTVTYLDDGTLEKVLTTLLPDGVCSGRSVMLPVTFPRYPAKALCVNYFSEYNSGVYGIFASLALQALNIFADTGVTVYLVDCEGGGSRYPGFEKLENADGRNKVRIVTSPEELLRTADELSKYIIETDSSCLNKSCKDIEKYNAGSAGKREVKILFVSSISEINSLELLTKLSAIAGSGPSRGVLSFFGISTDECQVSGVTTQERVTAVTLLMELCEKVYMSSDGTLSFGNGTPQFAAAPDMSPEIKDKLLRRFAQDTDI